MKSLKESLQNLQSNEMQILKIMSNILLSNSMSGKVLAKQMDDLLFCMENQCIQARVMLEQFRPVDSGMAQPYAADVISDIAGNLEVTSEGWLHITLCTLLPSCRHRVSNYIGDTIARLVAGYGYGLPYYEQAFMGIVEYCSYENHNALDNDNKGWKMIPNALKGRVIEDDSQFCLSIGLFSKLSEDLRCEIYVLPIEEADIFMQMLCEDML